MNFTMFYNRGLLEELRKLVESNDQIAIRLVISGGFPSHSFAY